MTDPRALLDRIDGLIEALESAVRDRASFVTAASPLCRASVANLLHYLALRRNDLRGLQKELAMLGLSSLGRSEGRVLFSIYQVRARLRDSLVARGIPVAERAMPSDIVTPQACEQLLHRNAQALFGPKPTPRHVYIMVTLPDAASVTPTWVREVLTAGANCFRVNTAHEDAVAWAQSIATIREQAGQMGRDARILVDLEGPRLRTLPLGPGVRVLKLKPPKDELGRVAGALSVSLGRDATIELPADCLHAMHIGDRLRFVDARGKKRKLIIAGMDGERVEALLEKTAYMTADSELHHTRAGHALRRVHPRGLPEVDKSVGVSVDDQFWLVGGAPAPSARGFVEVPISLPEVLPALAVGHRVFLDDGRLESVAVDVRPGRVLCRVVRTPAGRFRIRGEMGINLPDTAMTLSAMSEKDTRSLDFALAYADMIGLSFARDAADVRAVREKIASSTRPIGLVVKIETSAAFRNMGELLVELMRHHPVAVMIARGDLAVEVGFERLAELQEEILWLCEAAHVPVIWATQVLENLAKTGLPSRAEVTDAAMSVRAECVMLNKGAYVTRAIAMLDSILQRMESHQYKKMALYRELLFR